MAAELILGGRFVWGGERDDEGHRTYTIAHRVKTTDPLDGPNTVMQCPGLPAIGATWNFGNDVDVWAFCLPSMKVDLFKQRPGHPHRHWLVSQRFTTKPLKRCQDASIEDPLLEPQKISGSFVKYTKEVFRDRFGNYIKSSSHEMIRGPQVEFDANRPQVNIEQNVPTLELDLLASMVDTVNDTPLWGLGTRRIKLSEAAWERKYFGQCSIYFTRQLGFDIAWEGWDREIVDEGTKALNGRNVNGVWTIENFKDGTVPDKNNPLHFIRYKDGNGEIARVILNGLGEPAREATATGTGTSFAPGQIAVDYYSEANLLLLGIPTDLES